MGGYGWMNSGSESSSGVHICRAALDKRGSCGCREEEGCNVFRGGWRVKKEGRKKKQEAKMAEENIGGNRCWCLYSMVDDGHCCPCDIRALILGNLED